MDIAALITWLATALGGLVLLARWTAGGGHRGGGNSRLAPSLVFGHLTLAVVGLVLWIIYLVAGGDGLAWAAFVVLLPVALIGFTMFARWLPARRTQVAESRFPLVIVLGHGLLAATTLVLVLLTAAGVG